MRDPIHTISASPASPTPFPVSSRFYKKKDYDYLSNFPRMTHPALSATCSDSALLQERSAHCDSDLSMTASSVGYAASTTSSSSTSSSAQSYAKNLIMAMEADTHSLHHDQQQQQHPHHFSSADPSAHPPPISVDSTESAIESKNDKIDPGPSGDVKDDISNITGDSPGPIEKTSGGAAVKAPGRSHSKTKPRQNNAPAVLPKFGSWDTRNPSSGEAYTLIFRRLRDEKQSGGLPVCTSPTDAKEEEPDESLSQESKPKEPLHPKPPVRKDSLRQKAKGKSHQGAAHNQKSATKWSLCCKASVLDD